MSEEKVKINRLQSIASSAAGPGSDFFRHYRTHRDKELDRLKVMEEEDKLLQQEELHARQIQLSRDRLESKTAKNREKRLKRKDVRKGVAIPADVKAKIVEDEIDSFPTRASSTEDIKDERIAKVQRIENRAHPGIRVTVEDEL